MSLALPQVRLSCVSATVTHSPKNGKKPLVLEPSQKATVKYDWEFTGAGHRGIHVSAWEPLQQRQQNETEAPRASMHWLTAAELNQGVSQSDIMRSVSLKAQHKVRLGCRRYFYPDGWKTGVIIL